MSKEIPLALKICDWISKYSIYALVFLVPIFFLPWTANVLDFNKQTLLIILVLASLFAWMLKVILSGELKVRLNYINVAVLVFVVICLASTIFSLWVYGSFWGWPSIVAESFLSIIGFALLYFLTSNIFSEKEIYKSVVLLLISSALSVIFGIFQLFGLFLFPLAFAKTASFNTIGSLSGLAILVAVLLPIISIFLLMEAKKPMKIFLAIFAVLCLATLILINYSFAWWLVLAGSVLVVVCGIKKRDLFSAKWLVLPMFLLAISLFSVFFQFHIGWLPQAPSEVFLNQKTSLGIALQTIKERPILGSGPGTFVYDFSKFKSANLNIGNFWNVEFNGGASKFLTTLATTGVLGVLSFLVLLGLVIFYGVRYFISEDNDDFYWLMSLGIFVAFALLAIAYFFYNSNFVLDFMLFFLLGAAVNLIFRQQKKYQLKPSSFLTLGTTFSFTVIFILGLGLLILASQNYIAQADYVAGVNSWQSGNVDQGLKLMEKAASSDPSVDVYFSNLAQAYLSKISQDPKSKDTQTFVSNAINASKIATDINPSNVNNWSVRGMVSQNLIGLVNGIDTVAITSYDQASALEPSSPYYLTQKGIVFLKQSSASGISADQKNQLISQAQDQFNKAIALKVDYIPAIMQTGLLYYQNADYPNAQAQFESAANLTPNYSDALYFLALTYDKEGHKDLAIAAIKQVIKLNPNNDQLTKILANLNSGKDALAGLGSNAAAAPVKK